MIGTDYLIEVKIPPRDYKRQIKLIKKLQDEHLRNYQGEAVDLVGAYRKKVARLFFKKAISVFGVHYAAAFMKRLYEQTLKDNYFNERTMLAVIQLNQWLELLAQEQLLVEEKPR